MYLILKEYTFRLSGTELNNVYIFSSFNPKSEMYFNYFRNKKLPKEKVQFFFVSLARRLKHCIYKVFINWQGYCLKYIFAFISLSWCGINKITTRTVTIFSSIRIRKSLHVTIVVYKTPHALISNSNISARTHAEENRIPLLFRTAKQAYNMLYTLTVCH